MRGATLILLTVLSLLSCGDNAPPRPKCRWDSDCPFGYICVGGICVATTPSYLLPSGYKISDCSCQGFVYDGELLANYNCASGYEIAMLCYGWWCPDGMLAWWSACW